MPDTPSPPRIRGMAPLLSVFDMAESLRFWRDALGFEVAGTSGDSSAEEAGWVLLRRSEIEIMLNTAFEPGSRPPEPDAARAAAHEDVAFYFGVRELGDAAAGLRAHGYEVDGPLETGYGFRALAVSDPDGYSVVFHWPLDPRAVQAWRDWYGFEPGVAE